MPQLIMVLSYKLSLFLVFFIIIILFLQSCSTDKNIMNKSVENISKENKSIKVKIKGIDFNADCSLLSAEDINKICNKDVKEVDAKLVKDAVCAKIFEFDKSKRIYFSYLDYGGTTPQQLRHCVNVLKGEKLSENACFVAGNINTAYIFGTRYTVTLQNMNLMQGYEVCSNLELMQLGKSISNRIYNNLTTSK